MRPHDHSHSHDHSATSNSSFWLFFNAVYKLLTVMSIFMQTSSVFDSGLLLLWDLPLQPIVDRTIPGIGLASALSIYVTLGSVITDWRSNFLIQNHDKLDAHLKSEEPRADNPSQVAVFGGQGQTPLSDPERQYTSGGESTYLGDLEAHRNSDNEASPVESTPLMPLKKPSGICCLRTKPCCTGITLNQKVFYVGDVLNHVLEKTGPIFLIWFSVKKNLWPASDNSLMLRAIEASVNLGALLIGIPASVTENASTLINLQKYNRFLLFEDAKSTKAKAQAEPLIKEVASSSLLG